MNVDVDEVRNQFVPDLIDFANVLFDVSRDCFERFLVADGRFEVALTILVTVNRLTTWRLFHRRSRHRHTNHRSAIPTLRQLPDLGLINLVPPPAVFAFKRNLHETPVLNPLRTTQLFDHQAVM